MSVAQAILLLIPYHNAQVINQYGNHAQLTTGHMNMPLIAINDGMVSTADLFEVLDFYDNEEPILPTFFMEDVNSTIYC